MRPKDTGMEIELPEQGLWEARCIALYDLGTHGNEYQGRTRDKHDVLIVWELPDQRYDVQVDDKTVNKPRAVSKFYTFSLNEKANLLKDLESWRGKAFTVEERREGFEIKNVLGATCQIQIMHKEKETGGLKAVLNILPFPKNVQARPAENPLRYFSFEDGTELAPDTPKGIQKLIMESNEWQAREFAGGPVERPRHDDNEPPEDDNLPF